MVVMLSDRENPADRQIARLLSGFKDIKVKGYHAAADINIKSGAAVLTDSGLCFKKQCLPKGITGICSDENKEGFKLFKRSGIPVITCGTGSKSTLTVSSITDSSILISLQRSITDMKGRLLEPCEIKLPLYSKDCFPVIACAAVLLLHGINPNDITL